MFAHIGKTAIRPAVVSFGIGILALAALLAGPVEPAAAQLTVESLIGSAVSDLGPKYDDVEQAIVRFQNGDVRGALQYLQNAKEKHPQLPPPDVTLAKMQMAYRNQGPANALLERAVKDYPEDPEAYILFADQSFAGGRLTDADTVYQKAADLAQNMTGNEKRKRAFITHTHTGQAAVAERRGDFETAEQHLKAWVESDPESATAHHRLGTTLFRLERYKEGYDEFSRARKLDPKLPHPDVTTAKLFHQMGKADEARKSFERAVQMDGENAETLFAYAQWLMEMGEAVAARQPLANARRIAPEHAQLLLFSGVASKMSGDMEEAEQYLLDALAIAPTSQDVLNQLALTLSDSEDETKRQRGLQFAQVSANLHPQNNESAVTLGWAFYRLNRLPEAEKTIQNALRMGQLNSDSSYLIARILFEQNKLDDAARILSSVVDDQGIFVHRQQAQQLRTQIDREQGMAPGGQ
jgi:Tfp pilus assembly protein PilF